MDFAVFSPRKKQQMLNQSLPRHSAHKRSLFPTNSPQSSDLGHISELSSDDSDTYSPFRLSPSSSITPEKKPTRAFGRVLQDADYSTLDVNTPSHKIQYLSRRSARMFDKENIANIQEMANKRQTKILDSCNFEDHFDTILPDSPDDDLFKEFNFKSTDNFTTPKKTISNLHNKSVRRSPRSANKNEVTIKPNSFYGNIAPDLATNQTNRIQGMKCVYRPMQPSRAKAKLLFEDKPKKKRGRSKSLDTTRESKRQRMLFTGVHHAIHKPMKPSSPPSSNEKRESIRDKARKITDLSRTPYGMKKHKKNIWDYTLRFTKPLRYEEELCSKRKFFKTSVKENSSPGTSDLISPNIPKKRKLLDSRKSYLEENSPKKPQLSTKDLSEMIDDLDEDKLQNPSEVDDILLRLEDDDSEEMKRKTERQMLMNILEDSPNEIFGIDSLSNFTASLDLNTSSDSGCSRISLDYSKEDKESHSKHLFSILQTKSSNRGSSRKKKWQGVGKNQLQIDAGQKQFGARQCNECGMIYQQGEAEDETYHNDFHNNLTKLRHINWKNENVVGAFGMDYALVVTRNDPKNWQQKALEVIALVDKSLGILNETPSIMYNQKVFLYVAEKRIVGCMVACPLTNAYRMESTESDVNLCSQETFSVRCGISRMWTLYSHRKQGVATRLLDTVRRNFMYGNILTKEDIAFSIPTSDGRAFATNYMGSPNFFVYTGY